MPTIRTFTGVLIDPLNPDPNLIDYIDIAHALSGEGRYSNHTPETYTVGMHTLIVTHMVDKEWKYDALNHDDDEAYLRDIPTPLKHAYFMEGYRRVSRRLMKAIAKKYRFAYPEPPEVSKWDVVVRKFEQYAFMRGSVMPHREDLGITPEQYGEVQGLIRSYSKKKRSEIKTEWIERFYQLCARHCFSSVLSLFSQFEKTGIRMVGNVACRGIVMSTEAKVADLLKDSYKAVDSGQLLKDLMERWEERRSSPEM